MMPTAGSSEYQTMASKALKVKSMPLWNLMMATRRPIELADVLRSISFADNHQKRGSTYKAPSRKIPQSAILLPLLNLSFQMICCGKSRIAMSIMAFGIAEPSKNVTMSMHFPSSE